MQLALKNDASGVDYGAVWSEELADEKVFRDRCNTPHIDIDNLDHASVRLRWNTC